MLELGAEAPIYEESREYISDTIHTLIDMLRKPQKRKTFGTGTLLLKDIEEESSSSNNEETFDETKHEESAIGDDVGVEQPNLVKKLAKLQELKIKTVNFARKIPRI